MSLCLAILIGAPGCPVKNTIAYSRDTTAGIPSRDRSSATTQPPIATSYFIYLVGGQGTPPSVKSVWLKGKYYAVTVRKVSSPVLVEREPAVPSREKLVLVPATSSPVYELQIGDEKPCHADNDEESRLTRDNELVVVLRVGRSTRYCPVKTITPLPPASGQ